MEIEVLTYGKRKELLEKLAGFYATQLNIDKSNCKVFVCTSPTLKAEGSLGVCARTGKREITVGLYSYLSFGRILYTLAHEMVHVKQMVRGHYRQEPKKRGDGVHHLWLGKRVNKQYINRPWEIEAMGREDELVESLSQFLEKQKKKSGKKKT